ncbi:Glycosyltransferase involved in cell wall bisynthesis [Desulfuromusa kysingii]|uniref:Glycosyltransferase involved in cell wall bisynthesis n=1 Tax=Desulfuromusa kysingii TaxID=37625 RepID=A0A1H3YHU0_9BACT|nr:glycosyltransferase family 4 protein [Desulfuromusa kysingii]SEA10442.1 Glycosyltransferase involved in cell wall bisynthesis [Desulfuromusa kysingii]
MKILQVTAALEQGGVERGTVEMAAFIVSQGVESFVASQGGRLVAELESQGSSHFNLPLAQRNPVTLLLSALRLKKIILTENITLVHARSRAPAWAAYIACRLTGVPFVTTFHGTHRIQNCIKKSYNSVMTRGLRTIAISQFIKTHIMENYGISEQLIDIAPRGFDPQRISPDKVTADQLNLLKKQWQLDDGVPIIALPGRLTRWKGQTLFLDALAQIKELQWQALIIGGAGHKQAYLNELKEQAFSSGLSDRIVFTGDQANIVPFYALADIVVSASTEPEAFGRVAVEAQAMGKPIIASAHGGALETVRDGETGWLFKNNDAEDLADKLRLALATGTDLIRMGNVAQTFVENEYTVEKMCRAEWNCYQRVLTDING